MHPTKNSRPLRSVLSGAVLALALAFAPCGSELGTPAFAADGASVVEQANEKFQQREVKAALELLDKAIADDPGNHEARILRQDILVAIDGEALVRKQAQAAAESAPDDMFTAYLAARLLEPEAAVARFTSLAKKFPDSPWMQAGLASALERQEKFAPAEKAYRKAMSLAPGDVQFEVYLAYGLETAGNYDTAAATWRSVLDQRPDDPAALIGLGSAQRMAGDLVEARKTFAKLVAKHPGDAEGIYLLALCHLDSGDHAGALEHAKKAVALDPNHVQALCAGADAALYLAQAKADEADEYLTEEDAADALAMAKKAAVLDPDSVQAHFTLGAVREALGESDLTFLEGALEDYDRVLELTPIPGPRRVRGLVAKAYVLLRLAKWSAALETAEKALDIDPENVPALLHAGHALVADGKAEKALKTVYKDALRITKNDDAAVQHAVGTAYWEDGKTSQAKKHLSRAAELEPENGQYQLSYGELQFALGEYDKAAKGALFNATELMPNNVQAWLSWARACTMETEFHESAIEGFEKVIELDPESVDEHLFLAILLARLETNDDDAAAANVDAAAAHALRWKEKGGANPNWDAWIEDLIAEADAN